ncbi:MAG: polar localization protein TipN, partial [Caulobacteraceae bacterium]
ASELTAPAAEPRPTGGPALNARRAPAFGSVLYLLAAVASILWAALAVFAYGYQGTVDLASMQTAVFAIMALAPIGFIWIFAYGVRQAARLAAEVVRAREISETMLMPAARAASETGSAVEAIRAEIEAATAAAAHAREEMLALREVMAEETRKLSEAAAESARTASQLGVNLGREREGLIDLSGRLDTQAVAVTEAVGRQARMVSDASDLAQAQIVEAEAALAARAADLAAAAGEASDAARIASEDLSRQTLRLETATTGVADQLRSLEETLTQQRAELVTVAHGMRVENEDFGVQLESQRAQLADMLAKARLSVADINAATTEGAGAVREFANAAAEQCRGLFETATAERDQLSAASLQSLGAVSETARYEREQMVADAERTLAAIAEHIEGHHKSLEGFSDIVHQKVVTLSEASFAAGQQAEAAFEARLQDANGLIAKSADLIDRAAAEAEARLETVGARAKSTLAEIEAAVAEFEARAARLPAETASHAQALKATLEGGFDDLLESARRAAAETEAIDQAFQDRVRRNYEMLSEAVRLMGVMGPTSRAALRAEPVAPAPLAPPPQVQPVAREPAEPAPSPSVAAPEPAPRPARRGLFERAPRRETAPESAAQDDASEAGLRPRLKLAPTDNDRAVSGVFDSARDQDAETPASVWTWQELLTSMDDAPLDEDKLTDRLIGELEALGVDLPALLPAGRLAEIAAVIQAGDEAGARIVIRKLAPAAIRRLSRRLLTERSLRAHADRYVARYQSALDEAAKRDRDGEAVEGLIASDAGRAYLLFDTALADLP